MIIAVDGPAASGKGTLASRLAQHFDFAYLNTGLLYRAVGLSVLRKHGDPSDPALAEQAALALQPTALDDPALIDDEAGNAASKVAAMPAVRAALVAMQRDFAHTPPGGKKGAVLDGRDIGTVICPDAAVKLYVTARPEVRAERRHKELLARRIAIIYPRVLQDLTERDARDAGRATAPLKPAADAVVLDTSDLSPEQVFETALAHVRAKLAARS